MTRYTITTQNDSFREAWGGDTITAEGDAHGLRVVAAPNAALIGEPIECISADGDEVEEQLSAMYAADVEIQPMDCATRPKLTPAANDI
jgi:hypothetical protein